MKIGITLRNMGVQSTPDLMADCARSAEDAGLESIWITDHIAIPPDDAEGSGGRYLDTLTTLAWLAGVTSTINIGSGVLIIPYRAALPTAKQIATVQEVSKGRLLMGVAVGWMDAEFRAVGVDRHARGRITDETLAFINECFASDEVEANGQKFLFKPRPPKPPMLIGGSAPYALKRAVAHGDGWFPMARSPDHIADDIAKYHEMSKAAGKPQGEVTVLTSLQLSDKQAADALVQDYERIGVSRIICGATYEDLGGYRHNVERIAALASS